MTHRAHWKYEPGDVEHEARNRGVVERVLERLVVAEESSLVRLDDQEQPQYRHPHCVDNKTNNYNRTKQNKSKQTIADRLL